MPKSEELQSEIQRLRELFEDSYITIQNELLLVPKTNLYFYLGNIETVLDLKCKVIAWCSRDACKTQYCRVNWRNEQYQKSVRDAINSFLGTEFTAEDWMYIYTYLGNDIRRELCEKFIERGYDLSVIKESVGK